MVEGRGGGFEIGTDWGAGIGGGVDRDRHGVGYVGVEWFLFFWFKFGRE